MKKIALLGFCEKFEHVRDQSDIFKWNILGLKSIIWSEIYPVALSNINIGLALNMSQDLSKAKIIIEDVNEKEVGFLELRFSTIEPDRKLDFSDKSTGSYRAPIPKFGWMPAFIHVGETDIVIPNPGPYRLVHVENDKRDIIGIVNFGIVYPVPLTEERINAIKSDPFAAKAVKLDLGCKKCPTKLKIYSDIESDSKLEKEGYINHKCLPDEFVCNCGNTKIDLKIIKQNLHGSLGKRFSQNKKLDFIPFYEKSSIENTRNNFLSLINKTPKEELIQKFIENNPILLHQFPADKIFFKPSILTAYKADFGILTTQRELILIEIEKAQTKLLKKDGTVAAELTYAVDQVLNWFQIIEDHKIAVLESIGIKKEDIDNIKGVVIAGRSINYEKHQLKKIKSKQWSNIDFLTYDDLLGAMQSLINNL
jgi:hypothetical protein